MIYCLCEDTGRDVYQTAMICEGPDGLDLEKLQKEYIKELVGDPPPAYRLYSQAPDDLALERQWEEWGRRKRQQCDWNVFFQKHGLKRLDYKEAECLF